MAYFVIAGMPDCGAFVHAIYVARYIAKKLPNFYVNIIQKKSGEWEPWCLDKNVKNNWHHTNAPLIWKELAMRGSKPHYLGGLTSFWEYCFDYYGLESIMSPEDIQKLLADNMQYFTEMEHEAKNEDIRKICIVGLSNPTLLGTVITQLNEIQVLKKRNGLVIYLYDMSELFEDGKALVDELLEDIQDLIINGQNATVLVVDNMKQALTNCELLIILGDYTRRENEEQTDWLLRNMSLMYHLADEINAFARRDLRVILSIEGPTCFNANVLIDTCTAIRIPNIVAVTADVALGPLKYAAEQAQVELRELSAPPVWGYVGIKEFIDIDSAIIRADIYRPYQRVIRNKGGSTLPLGIVQSELRFMNYLVNNVDHTLQQATNARKIIKKKLHRPPFMAKIRALISLIRLWFAEESSDEIISLGIASNGSYGISGGIVFSQPVILSKKVWVSFKNFPVPECSDNKIQDVYHDVLTLIEHMGVGPFYVDSRSYGSYV